MQCGWYILKRLFSSVYLEVVPVGAQTRQHSSAGLALHRNLFLSFVHLFDVRVEASAQGKALAALFARKLVLEVDCSNVRLQPGLVPGGKIIGIFMGKINKQSEIHQYLTGSAICVN
jgi:hypothetical protein